MPAMGKSILYLIKENYMLQIKHISKTYTTGTLVQRALDDVTLNLRDCEFVAVLGPSGSGKTTLLNVIGGLDRYDSGDLVIGGISTQKYRDRDWDSYRNHTIGFVFQSYNLIPHQSVLANVELALTISGIKRSERRRRAAEALEKVGLGDQLHKKPNQMSGGQMQRVAIARALVNDPDILLADEPTGALDSETSVQVMDLLSEVAKDRLVVMVTHNPDLAEKYATRIVRLRDGRITDDTAPFEIDNTKLTPPVHKNMGKSSMSYLTSLSLSFNNLRTKKGRTLLTSFAGSIGIIGIALILSLSNGVNTFINDQQKSTMTAYPITIDAQTFDLSSLMNTSSPMTDTVVDHELDAVYSNGRDLEIASTMSTSFKENNLSAFKKYLDNPDSEINKYIGENGIVYSYKTKFTVYSRDPDGNLVNTDGSTLTASGSASAVAVGNAGAMSSGQNSSSGMSMGASMGMMNGTASNMQELIPGTNGTVISAATTDSYDVLYGEWPDAYDEVVLVLDKNNEITTETLYQLGFLPSDDCLELMKKLDASEEITVDDERLDYAEICERTFTLLPACDIYKDDGDGTFSYAATTDDELETLLDSALTLHVSGIIRPVEDAANASVRAPLGYTKLLTDYLISHTDESAVAVAQEASPDTNVLTGLSFEPSDDAAKISDTKTYLASLGVSDKAKIFSGMMQKKYADQPEMAAQLATAGETEMAAALDRYLTAPDDDVLLAIYDSYITAGNYDDNMTAFGVVSIDAPSYISIYSDSFDSKDSISDCIKAYNDTVGEEDKITYTDYVALLMSSVTTIVNVISYVLIAFVAVSLVVSSIMIGIITYISVLERTKEIGILRAIGASKRNISQVFNAETFIIGLCSGIIGIGVTLLLLIPGNMLIHSLAGSNDINALLPAAGAVILIVLSMLLTLIGGLIPSKKAAHKDPVTALRTE